MISSAMAVWPELHYDEWSATCSTLQLWTQVVGKIRLAQTPWLNHSWHVPLYVTVTGLTTSMIPFDHRSFEIQFDFNQHVLDIAVSDVASRRLPLRPQSVADFFAMVMSALRDLGIAVAITELPCEIAGAVPFSQDTTHAAYDPEYVGRFWRVLLQADRVFTRFRSGFIGKCSPVHFFWGSCDLAVTRFSGRRAPTFAGKVPGLAAKVMQEAYSHEVSSAGFWPGGSGLDAAFYSYAYPEPPGFRTTPVQPEDAFFSAALGEFMLPYDVVRRAVDPDATLLAFLHSTYDAAALCAKWDRTSLECPDGRPGICREI